MKIKNTMILFLSIILIVMRIAAFNRLDFACKIGQGYWKDRKFRSSYTFSIYKLYSRSNAFSVFFPQQPLDRTRANQLAIIGSIFPARSINIVFV